MGCFVDEEGGMAWSGFALALLAFLFVPFVSTLRWLQAAMGMCVGVFAYTALEWKWPGVFPGAVTERVPISLAIGIGVAGLVEFSACTSRQGICLLFLALVVLVPTIGHNSQLILDWMHDHIWSAAPSSIGLLLFAILLLASIALIAYLKKRGTFTVLFAVVCCTLASVLLAIFTYTVYLEHGFHTDSQPPNREVCCFGNERPDRCPLGLDHWLPVVLFVSFLVVSGVATYIRYHGCCCGCHCRRGARASTAAATKYIQLDSVAIQTEPHDDDNDHDHDHHENVRGTSQTPEK